MSNPVFQYYAQLAKEDEERAATLRRFGCLASAGYLEDRAAFRRKQAFAVSRKKPPPDEPNGGFVLPSCPENHETSSTHTTSDE